MGLNRLEVITPIMPTIQGTYTLFIAADIEENSLLRALQNQTKQLLKHPEPIPHITLVHLGLFRITEHNPHDLYQATISSLERTCDLFIADFKMQTLAQVKLEAQLELFSNALVLRLKPGAAYDALQELAHLLQIQTAASKESKPFVPHITLGRVKKDVTPESLIEYQKYIKPVIINIPSCSLYQSGPSGEHRLLARYKL